MALGQPTQAFNKGPSNGENRALFMLQSAFASPLKVHGTKIPRRLHSDKNRFKCSHLAVARTFRAGGSIEQVFIVGKAGRQARETYFCCVGRQRLHEL